MNNRNRNIIKASRGYSNITHKSLFEEIISLENLFIAWREFKKGKNKKQDVQQFEFNLEDNLFKLHLELKQKQYYPDDYTSFYICDPKLRHIHKASIRDRVVHHAVFRILYPFFDKRFIHDSYSCRLNKGTHRGVLRLKNFSCKITSNYRNSAYVLKCDIRKFFASIDHDVLIGLIRKTIYCPDTLWLTIKIIKSFGSETNKGLPLGNVTSQLFANIYLNELDQFVKHTLKEKYYIRYCDDFLIFSKDQKHLIKTIPLISDFLSANLKLSLHPNKIFTRKLSYGIDFLGYVGLPHYSILRTKTKRRMFRKIRQNKNKLRVGVISQEKSKQSLQSYFGVLKHCKGFKIKKYLNKIQSMIQ
ncbi:MAG: RNA-dependent DNA polymerase [Parcubacteria group bacterium]|nr:RNA-dependent DNA polymerase [Parcubacteria group bacterium]